MLVLTRSFGLLAQVEEPLCLQLFNFPTSLHLLSPSPSCAAQPLHWLPGDSSGLVRTVTPLITTYYSVLKP